MAGLFWRFCMYSFLGYLLERLYAAATRSPRQVRKGFLLLPLCPVYGLGVLAVEALPPALTGNFFSLALWGGLTATAVEYAVHWAYDCGAGGKVLGLHRRLGQSQRADLGAFLPGLGRAAGGALPLASAPAGGGSGLPGTGVDLGGGAGGGSGWGGVPGAAVAVP